MPTMLSEGDPPLLMEGILAMPSNGDPPLLAQLEADQTVQGVLLD